MLDKKDYMEPMCPFDKSFHKDADKSKPSGRINVGEMISQVDRLYSRNDKDGAIRVLEEYCRAAENYRDHEGELTAVSELLGSYRITRRKEEGLKTAERCFELLKLSGTGGSISAGTVLINCGTMLSSFGKTEKALMCYTDACRCYASHLPAEDERFAALYNNMASVYEQKGDFESAEKYYKTASAVLLKNKDKHNCILDLAVTYINLAQLYNVTEAYDKIDEYVKMAEEILDSDTEYDYYYAHTAEKIAGGFGYLGYFIKENELKETARRIYEGN